MEKTKDILVRSRRFSLRIIRLYTQLPKTPIEQTLGKQLLRSGTSVGAHLHEGKRSRSNAELISKIEGALQELEESVYWMELLYEAGIFPRPKLEGLLTEADQLTAILVTSAKRIKRIKAGSQKIS